MHGERVAAFLIEAVALARLRANLILRRYDLDDALEAAEEGRRRMREVDHHLVFLWRCFAVADKHSYVIAPFADQTMGQEADVAKSPQQIIDTLRLSLGSRM